MRTRPFERISAHIVTVCMCPGSCFETRTSLDGLRRVWADESAVGARALRRRLVSVGFRRATARRFRVAWRPQAAVGGGPLWGQHVGAGPDRRKPHARSVRHCFRAEHALRKTLEFLRSASALGVLETCHPKLERKPAEDFPDRFLIVRHVERGFDADSEAGSLKTLSPRTVTPASVNAARSLLQGASARA